MIPRVRAKYGSIQIASKSTLLGVWCHDFRFSLNTILHSSTLGVKEEGLGEPCQRLADQAQDVLLLLCRYFWYRDTAKNGLARPINSEQFHPVVAWCHLRDEVSSSRKFLGPVLQRGMVSRGDPHVPDMG